MRDIALAIIASHPTGAKIPHRMCLALCALFG